MSIRSFLNFDGSKCNETQDYSFDACVKEYFHRKNLDQNGCESHFGKLEDICEDSNKRFKEAWIGKDFSKITVLIWTSP